MTEIPPPLMNGVVGLAVNDLINGSWILAASLLIEVVTDCDLYLAEAVYSSAFFFSI